MKNLFLLVSLLTFSCFSFAEDGASSEGEPSAAGGQPIAMGGQPSAFETDANKSFTDTYFPWVKEVTLENIGLGDWSWDDVSWKNIKDMEGWTPRYSYVVDDNLIGRTHYMGMSFLKRQGAAHEGITLRGGFGHFGEKINLAYTAGFSMLGVDFGLSYLLLDKKNVRQHDNEIEGLGLEMGLRFWVVQLQAIHLDGFSYVNLAYGF